MSELLKQERITDDPKLEIPEEQLKPASQDVVVVDTISDLFQDRDQELASTSKVPTAAKLPEAQKHLQQEETPKEAVEVKSPAAKERETTLSDLQTLQETLEKTQKRLTENQQYGRQNAQRLKATLKVVKELEAEGSLSEDEAARLLTSLDTNKDTGLEQEELSATASHPAFHPFGTVLAIANQELETIRKYTDDETLDDKVRAFDYFLTVASSQEKEKTLEELSDLKETPLKLAKAMLSLGQKYQTSYQEMQASGSLFGYLAKKDQDIDQLTKSIDKLTKKLSQYEDYDKPRYRLEEMGEFEGPEALVDTITSLFDDRDSRRRR